MYTLNANIFLGDLDTKNPHHAACHTLLEHLYVTTTTIIIPLFVLAEVASFVSQELHDPKRGRLAVSLLRSMQHIRLVGLNDGLAQDAVELACDYSLSGYDAVYVAVARYYAIPLVTVDRELCKRMAGIIPVHTPEEVLAAIRP